MTISWAWTVKLSISSVAILRIHTVSDQLLRWHFRQSVLANVRGAGEPIFEHDFPPGTDMMSEICEGPYAGERLEMEVASRLRGFV